MRLDKYLADLGIGTRKELKEIIKSGRVAVNGNAVRQNDFQVNEKEDIVKLDGGVLSYSEFRYFAMDKPEGILTASEDKKQRTVIDILPPELKKLGLFPAGRLDKDTSGLLILTNDGEFAHKIISPKYSIEKTYIAVTDGTPDENDIKAFREGITLKDGLKCKSAELSILCDNKCSVTLTEGKYHQVRRMLASVGKPVEELRRIKIGPLELQSDSKRGDVVEFSQKIFDEFF